MKLYLLLYDDYVGDYFTWGVFDDDEGGWKTIRNIVKNGVGYRVIKGNIVEEQKCCDEWEEY